MPGNRFGAMQKTVRDMSLAEASPISEGFPPSDEAGENQLLIKFRPPSTLRQIVGFSPKVPFGSKEENVLLPADRAQIKSSASPKSARPASGLESLFSAPPLSGTRDILPKHVCVHETTVGRTNKIEFPLSSCSHYQHSDVFQNNLKHSHPIPICQSKKPQDEFCKHVQEQQIDQGKLPYDGPVRYRRHAAAFPEHKMLPLRPQRFKLVQESDIENGLLLSFSDQNKHAGTTSFATMDFMKACFLCKRKLGHGLDIYMYRGDKAFCSMDCRNHQIVLDERAERREKCSSVALMSESSTKSTRSNHRNRISVASTVAAA